MVAKNSVDYEASGLTAVCQESLRIYPVAVLTVPRAVKEPVELIGKEGAESQ